MRQETWVLIFSAWLWPTNRPHIQTLLDQDAIKSVTRNQALEFAFEGDGNPINFGNVFACHKDLYIIGRYEMISITC